MAFAYVLILFACIIAAVILHEFGHYLAARHCGIIPEEFNIGFGPRLFGFRKGGTDWNVRLIMLGGSNEFKEKSQAQFDALPVKKQIHIIAAGIEANLVLAFVSWLIYTAQRGLTLVQGIITYGKMIVMIMPGTISAIADFCAPGAKSDITAMYETGSMFAQSSMSMLLISVMLFSAMNAILGVTNLFPIPAMDGGQIVLRIPALFHHPLSKEAMSKAIMTSFYILIGCTIAYILRDVMLYLTSVL